jgi:transketolase
VATPERRAEIARGGYVLKDAPADRRPQAVIIATGSEVGLALEAQARLLADEALAVRVVSVPCTRVFEAQGEAWIDEVLPPTLPVVAVEAGHPDGWRRYTGRRGTVIGMTRFGESAPGPTLMQHFGFTAEAVAAAVRHGIAAAHRG